MPKLRDLTVDLLENEPRGAAHPASPRTPHNHHAFVGGFSGARAERQPARASIWPTSTMDYYPDLQPRLKQGDWSSPAASCTTIGKFAREIEEQAAGGRVHRGRQSDRPYPARGRDIVREAAHRARAPTPKCSYGLEHIIVAHQRPARVGVAPKPPMTPEALLVHYRPTTSTPSNHMMYAVLSGGPTAAQGAGHVAEERPVSEGLQGGCDGYRRPRGVPNSISRPAATLAKPDAPIL